MKNLKFNSKISVVICMLLLPIISLAQTKTKQLKLKFVSYECGDACYYTFKNMVTQKEFSFAYEDEIYEKCSTNCKNLFAEIDMKCDEKFDNCALKGQEYIATQEYKLVPIYEMTEEGVVNKTNKKEYKWVIVNMEKIKTNTTTSKNKNYILKGKIIVSEIQGNAYYRILVKPENSLNKYGTEVEFYFPYTTWKQISYYKNGIKSTDPIAALNDWLVEGAIIGIVGKDTNYQDNPILPTEIYIIK